MSFLDGFIQVPGFSSYLVSRTGEVVSIRKRWRNGPKRLKPHKHPYGHLFLMLTADDGKNRTKGVHQLVLESFVGPCPDGMEGCHEDGNASNNTLTNLRWDTPVNNREDMRRHGRLPCRSRGNCKLSIADIDRIKRLWSIGFMNQSEIAREYGLNSSTVSRLVRERHKIVGLD